MQHMLSTLEQGLVMQLGGCWDGNKNFEFKINGISDFGDVTEPNSQKHCGGLQVLLNKAPIAHKNEMQTRISLSMVKGELIAACEAAQIVLF